MELRLGVTAHEVEAVVACDTGIFSEQADKGGSVRIEGADGRTALALVEQARLLFREYPEDCVGLEEGDEVRLAGSPLAGVVLLVAAGAGTALLASRLDPGRTREGLSRLSRYVTRLVRLDVP